MFFICEYYSILYVFRLEPSTVVQKTYDVCVNKRVHSSAWFQARLITITSYIQTTESRNSVVEGTAQGNYLRGWGLSVEKGRDAAQFEQRGANSNNDDGGANNCSGSQQRQQRELQRISSGSGGSFSASAAAAAGFSASGARGRLS